MDKITLYHNLFLGCLIACIALAALAVLLFFVLDIRSVIGYLTGRSRRTQIQKMEAESAQSGRLFRKTRSGMQYADSQMKEDMGVQDSVSPGARKVENAVRSARSAELMSSQGAAEPVPDPQTPPHGGGEPTSLLQDGSENTSLLQDGSESTSLLRGRTEEIAPSQRPSAQGSPPAEAGATEYLEHVRQDGQEKANRSTNGTFRIEREIVMIHAEEVI
ncbi:MAG: hypothetical protein LUD53_01635 [Clostridiales bacterium]|nr:hypothetical protein [Clostridiales bacterium]